MAGPKASALRPRKRPTQARSRATVHAILEAAARVFAVRGYAGPVGSLYEYFPNKDALLVALVEQHIAEAGALLSQVADQALQPDGDLSSAVSALVQAMIALHAQNPRLHRVLFEEAPLPAAVRQRLEALESAMADRVAAYLCARSDVCVADPQLAASVLVQTIEALTHRLVIHGDPTRHATLADEMVTLATAYLTAPRAARHRTTAHPGLVSSPAPRSSRRRQHAP